MKKKMRKKSLKDLDQWDLVLVWDLDLVLECHPDRALEWPQDLDLQ